MLIRPDFVNVKTIGNPQSFDPGSLEEKAFMHFSNYIRLSKENQKWGIYRIGFKEAIIDQKEGNLCIFNFIYNIDLLAFDKGYNFTSNANAGNIKKIIETNQFLVEKYHEKIISIVLPFPNWMVEEFKGYLKDERFREQIDI